MKKHFVLMLLLLMSLGSSAQGVKGDIDGDGKLTMNDVTMLIDMYLNPANHSNPDPSEVSGLTFSSCTASFISSTGINLSGHIDGLEDRVSSTYTCGFVYGTTPDPTPENGKFVAVTPQNGNLSLDITDLADETLYYYRIAVATNKNEVSYSGTESFYMSSIQITPGDVIDLGLSVKWASCNLGASNPHEAGNLYAWGETEAKSSFTESNYAHYNSAFDIYNDIGSLISGNPLYDAATAAYGDDWHMPNAFELNELVNDCQWEKVEYRSKWGYKVTGPNGNSIFLPYTGYWSGTQSSNNTNGSTVLTTESKINANQSASRYQGLAIRPVKGYSVDEINGLVALLNVSYLPAGAEVGFLVGQGSTLTEQNSKYVASQLNNDGTFVLRGQTDSYRFRPVVKNGTATICASKHGNSVQFVNLGLSVKWATCNVGAEVPGDRGSYFSWGETKTKFNYSFSAPHLAEKYGSDSEKTVLDNEDDAAYVNWLGACRMPTKEEWNELMRGCYWQWVDSYQGGTCGFVVYRAKDDADKGKTSFKRTPPVETYTLLDPHIFLPAASSYNGTYIDLSGLYGGFHGNYWSSTLSTQALNAEMFGFESVYGELYWRTSNWVGGMSIRPVCE